MLSHVPNVLHGFSELLHISGAIGENLCQFRNDLRGWLKWNVFGQAQVGTRAQ